MWASKEASRGHRIIRGKAYAKLRSRFSGLFSREQAFLAHWAADMLQYGSS